MRLGHSDLNFAIDTVYVNGLSIKPFANTSCQLKFRAQA